MLQEGNGTPLQYSCLKNPMDGEAWWATVHGVTKSWTWLRDCTFHFHPLEKEMATHFSVLASGISWTEEPGGSQSMGSKWVGHDLAQHSPIRWMTKYKGHLSHLTHIQKSLTGIDQISIIFIIIFSQWKIASKVWNYWGRVGIIPRLK